jgi:GNAT superfamily N-acetyltransferase
MVNDITVVEITKDEVARATETLIAAFEHDDFIKCVCGDGDDSIGRKQVFFSSIINYCRLYGKAYRTQGFEAIACRRMPGDTKFTFWRMLRSGMLKLRGGLGKDKFNILMTISERMDALAKENLSGKEYVYCWTLGTHPDKQRQGYGGALMRKTFNFAQSLNVPCYLDTFTDSALSAHKHNGYIELARHYFTDIDLNMYAMLNDFKSKSDE